MLVLPYASNKGEKILKLMNKISSRVSPCNYKVYIAYSGTKLSNRFQLKDQTKTDHLHDVFIMQNAPKNSVQKITQEKREDI